MHRINPLFIFDGNFQRLYDGENENVLLNYLNLNKILTRTKLVKIANSLWNINIII